MSNTAYQRAVISIHALREEGDVYSKIKHQLTENFYPRPPRGGRLLGPTSICDIGDFYPRPPRGGRPAWRTPRRLPNGYFYPRPPRGGRLEELKGQEPAQKISIHALREEGDSRS